MWSERLYKAFKTETFWHITLYTGNNCDAREALSCLVKTALLPEAHSISSDC